ncbi:MAG: flagellar motor protein MotB [Comamonadaceae bacterium]
MSDDGIKPIIVKRVKKLAPAHHGGAWKIAYADFVTAMMAFFLLMWLLGSTTSGELKGIAEYFQTPLKVALGGGSGTGDSSSIIKGGGQDLTRTEGQMKKGEIREEKKTINLKAAEAELARKELLKLQELKGRIEGAIENNAALKPFRNQILLDITAEGLRIQIADENNRPMFASGSAQLQPYSRDILREIGHSLNDTPNRISISGHTDAHPYSGGSKGYSNWELSADRANAARRELTVGGLDETRVLRVIGLSSAVLLDPADPSNPVNRRISIIVMNKKTEGLVSKDGEVTEIDPKPDSPAGTPAGTTDATVAKP